MPTSVEQGPRGGRFYLSSTGQKIYLGQREAPEDREARAEEARGASAEAEKVSHYVAALSDVHMGDRPELKEYHQDRKDALSDTREAEKSGIAGDHDDAADSHEIAAETLRSVPPPEGYERDPAYTDPVQARYHDKMARYHSSRAETLREDDDDGSYGYTIGDQTFRHGQ